MDLRTDPKTHGFKRHLTTCSNLITTLDIHIKLQYYEENGYGLDLDLRIISYKSCISFLGDGG